MKNMMKVILSIIFVIVVLGVVFCIVDTLRVHNEEDPIFAFSHKIIDGIDYSAKVDTGLGYKIIRLQYQNLPEQIKIGTIFMSETISSTSEENQEILESGETDSYVESGDLSGEIVKVTTFGDKYTETIVLEGMEQEVYAQNINSKLGYSMVYYYDFFDYVGYEDHDKYTWNQTSGDASGDLKSVMTVYNISNEELYKETLENIDKKGLFEEVSGEENNRIQKLYHRAFEENEVQKVNYIYIMWLDDLKLMVDLYMPQEAEEGVGQFMHQMAKSIEK